MEREIKQRIVDRIDVKRKPGRPKIAHPKGHVSIRLDKDVLNYFRSTGAGWQSRINQILKDVATREGKENGNI